MLAAAGLHLSQLLESRRPKQFLLTSNTEISLYKMFKAFYLALIILSWVPWYLGYDRLGFGLSTS